MTAAKPTKRWSRRVTETSENLPAAEKKILMRAKDELRKLYGRPIQAETR
jgi:hypothetical protein